MIAISIDPALKTKVEALTLGCISAAVTVSEHDAALWQIITQRLETLQAELTTAQIPTLPAVQAQRAAYKTIGKDPGRYRGSAEALLRRVVQGKGLPAINTLVDINNLLSLETRHPIGAYDLGKLRGPVILRIGQSGESYQGIGKGAINIENLPVLADADGPFGSPTSDSQRAPVTPAASEILLVIFAFSGPADLAKNLQRAGELLTRHAAAQQIETRIIA